MFLCIVLAALFITGATGLIGCDDTSTCSGLKAAFLAKGQYICSLPSMRIFCNKTCGLCPHSATNTQSPTQAGCHNGWVQHDGSCYYISEGTESWFEAAVYAAWIGANDMVIEGEWIWAHLDQQMSYTNWNVGEPNDISGYEDCGFIYPSGFWNDEGCHELWNYVCEVPVSGDGSFVG